MVRTDDLIRWAKENAVDCSLNYVNGWISADKLLELAQAAKDLEPFVYFPVIKNDENVDSKTNIAGG